MRNGFLGSLAALALSGGLALAQSWGPYAPAPTAPGWGGYPMAPAGPRPPAAPWGYPAVAGIPVARGADGRPLSVNFGPRLEDLDDALGDTPPAAPPGSSAGKLPAGKPAPASAPAPTPAANARTAPASASPPVVDEGPEGPAYVGDPFPSAPPGPPDGPPSGSPGEPPAERDHEWFWIQADYLMWWYKSAPTPPLLTSGTTGVLGASGTDVLIQDLKFNDNFRNGAEFRGGVQLGCLPVGLEARYFFLDDRTLGQDVSSNGSQLLGRPYFNAVLNQEDVFQIASPGSPGSFHVETRSRLWDLDWNLACAVEGNECWSVVGLLGFRYMDLAEDLRTTDQFTTENLVPIFGAVPAVVTDQFGTRNQMYAGQVGVDVEAHRGPFFLNVRFEGILGDNHQTVFIQGNSALTTANGKVLLPVGRFALPTNAGNFNRDEITYAPEVGLNVGFQLTKWLRVHAGYTFLYWANVVRPGDQIDRGVNPNLVPTAVGPGGPGGPARPAFTFAQSDFWAQGLNAGIELHY
jgi:hypothetical protein